MILLLIVLFALGYLLITLESPLKIDKAATALLTGAGCWIVLASDASGFVPSAEFADYPAFIKKSLFEHLGEISEILFFLLGAMTIVELVDVHDGFRIITDRIATTHRIRLLWLLSWVAFFLSATLDNLTTAIVMCALLRRLVKNPQTRWLYGGFIIIAANAGGAWSPIGDVTTIMLWIDGRVSSLGIMQALFLPSLASLLAPLLAATFMLRRQGEPVNLPASDTPEEHRATPFEKNLLFALGSLALLFVPVFKYTTHLPPYLGVLLGVGALWYVTELIHRDKADETQHELSVATMLRRIDTPSILFFLGILLAVAALETSGLLHDASVMISRIFGNVYAINTMIGLLSAVVDNVPLVAAAMGMYGDPEYPMDHQFWDLLAFCAGTGGSILIIGSAAGVAAMGILKMDFLWYLKKISLYALIGYVVGIGVFFLLQG